MPPPDPLQRWLGLDWSMPERSYNPDAKVFLAALLRYPLDKVDVEDRSVAGFPDIHLRSPEGVTWIVGDLKKDDHHLSDPLKFAALWSDKKKYVQGTTRYVLFLTSHLLRVLKPTGEPTPELPDNLDLRSSSLDELRHKLAFVSYERSGHTEQWKALIDGRLPFCYLSLLDPNAVPRLQDDLTRSFLELTQAAERAFAGFMARYREYEQRRGEIDSMAIGHVETKERAILQLEMRFETPRRLIEESFRQFDDHFGRTTEGSRETRIQEAFVSDSVAALIARVLFLRLLEDLGMTTKRRLTNGGPSRWSQFVEELAYDARSLVRISGDDVARIYTEPFESTIFNWIILANGSLDEALQRLIIRLNPYDFSGLSEEVVGDIYQRFLPAAKRKKLGEFYTPPSIIDYLLDRVDEKNATSLLDPSCGSGSFIVRHAHRRLRDAEERGLDPRISSDLLSEQVWGFDINPFASLISHFQLTWALIRHGRTGTAPNVHIYNLNSLLKDNDIREVLGDDLLPGGAAARDTKKWSCIVGNPPYIRAERGKYAQEVRRLWPEVWGQNIDAGIVLLYRAIREWLDDGCILAMVVSGGFASSGAAGKLWRLLQPETGTATLKEIVWLEFNTSLWDPSVIPMLLVIEKRTPSKTDTIELRVPDDWDRESHTRLAPSVVKYVDFFDQRINPPGEAATFGEYLLPLLRGEDVPIIRKLQPDLKPDRFLQRHIDWTYGIQKGALSRTTEAASGVKPVRVLTGKSISIAAWSEVAGYVDVDSAQKRSLWASGSGPVEYVALPTIIQAPTATVIQSQHGDLACLNSTLVGFSQSVDNRVIASYLNSKAARFVYLVRERTAPLAGSFRSTLYPRSLHRLPWPDGQFIDQAGDLVRAYDDLAQLALRARNNPVAWFLDACDEALSKGWSHVQDSQFGLRILTQDFEVPADAVTSSGSLVKTAGQTLAEFASEELAAYASLVLRHSAEDDDQQVSAGDIQRLLVPNNVAEIVTEFRARHAQFLSVESDFFSVLDSIDQMVFDAFSLSTGERSHIESRLRGYPLSLLSQRFPWQAVKPKKIACYTEDRFR